MGALSSKRTLMRREKSNFVVHLSVCRCLVICRSILSAIWQVWVELLLCMYRISWFTYFFSDWLTRDKYQHISKIPLNVNRSSRSKCFAGVRRHFATSVTRHVTLLRKPEQSRHHHSNCEMVNEGTCTYRHWTHVLVYLLRQYIY